MRKSAEGGSPQTLEDVYRLMTSKELEARASELNDAIMIAASQRMNELVELGQFERVTLEAQKEREQSVRAASVDGKRRFSGAVRRQLANESVEYGWLEFVYLDEPTIASLERERIFVKDKREKNRESGKPN